MNVFKLRGLRTSICSVHEAGCLSSQPGTEDWRIPGESPVHTGWERIGSVIGKTSGSTSSSVDQTHDADTKAGSQKASVPRGLPLICAAQYWQVTPTFRVGLPILNNLAKKTPSGHAPRVS